MLRSENGVKQFSDRSLVGVVWFGFVFVWLFSALFCCCFTVPEFKPGLHKHTGKYCTAKLHLGLEEWIGEGASASVCRTFGWQASWEGSVIALPAVFMAAAGVARDVRSELLPSFNFSFSHEYFLVFMKIYLSKYFYFLSLFLLNNLHIHCWENWEM